MAMILEHSSSLVVLVFRKLIMVNKLTSKKTGHSKMSLVFQRLKVNK